MINLANEAELMAEMASKQGPRPQSKKINRVNNQDKLVNRV